MSFFRIPCLVLTLTCGHAAFATPESDARFIAQRQLGPEGLEACRGIFKETFAHVYFEPLAGLGIELIDQDRFAALVPDEDVAPFIDLLIAYAAENYLSDFSPAKLEAVATLLRADADVTVKEVLSRNYLEQQITALEQVQAEEEFVAQLSAASMLMASIGEDPFQQAGLGIRVMGALGSYAREIDQLEREIDNPVVIDGLKADGILEFANPVQRQDLLRQLTRSESTGGIQFIQAPTQSDD
jgi:hypothetical protein